MKDPLPNYKISHWAMAKDDISVNELFAAYKYDVHQLLD